MKFIALFILMLDCIWGNITKAMIDEVNEEVLRKNGLMSSALDPYYPYIYGDVILSQLGKSYFDINPFFKNFIDRIFGEDKPAGILSATLNTFFCSSGGIIDTSNVLNSSIAKKYFSRNESRFNNIKIFSGFFLKLLKKDKSIKLTRKRKYDENLIIDPELSDILNKNIEVDQNTLVFTLITLNAFMLEVLDTTEELKEYITNILDHLTDEDKEYIKTSPYYFFNFNKVESESNEITIFNILYNIPHSKFVSNFYKLREYDIPIPVYDRFDDEFEQGSIFNYNIDITLLQLCNFLFYNEKKEQFDLEHLQLDKDSDILKFYNKYKRPFDILNRNIREDWSKVLKNLCFINISVQYSKDYMGRIDYEEDSYKNRVEPSISNVVILLTKICSSENNNIEAKYTELFDRELNADNVDNLLESFFKLLVKNSANLYCESMGIEIIEDNSIYGNINLTTIANYEEESTKQLTFTFTIYYTNFYYNFGEKFQFLTTLEKISFIFKDDKEFNALEFIIVIYVDELKKKLFDRVSPPKTREYNLLRTFFRW